MRQKSTEELSDMGLAFGGIRRNAGRLASQLTRLISATANIENASGEKSLPRTEALLDRGRPPGVSVTSDRDVALVFPEASIPYPFVTALQRV